MAEQQVTRRLAAILAADMAGYGRLMAADETGTIARQKAYRSDLIDPEITRHGGRIVKTTGDGLLVEFPSVVDAVACAVSVQRAITEREAGVPERQRIAYRIGINLGDVVIDGADILGNGVNVAARLEALAEPGGICISGAVHAQVESTLDLEIESLGDKQLKNIAAPVAVYRIAIAEPDQPAARDGKAPSVESQSIRFCRSFDGTMIAFATVGDGPPLVKAPNWLNHLEYDWESPVWRHWFRELAKDHRLVRFDQRGNGLSDWDVSDIDFEALVRDMQAVIDAAGLQRFPLVGISQGCAISIAYAVRNPDRVSRLVLYGGYARGQKQRPGDAAKLAEVENTLILTGWGQNNPAYRQFFTTAFAPDASKEQMDWFNELQRITTSPENAVRLNTAYHHIDVSDLCTEISVPALVLHGRDDGVVPFQEGRRMAALIPRARFVPLETRNHLLLEDEPAWQRFLSEAKSFLAAGDN